MKPQFDLGVYLVTDQSLSLGRRTADIVRDAVAGGATIVQLREKKASTRTFYEEALEVKRVLKGTGVPLIINDRLDIALAIDAEGVHVGNSDMPISMVRQLVGANKIVGLSIESLDDAKKEDIQYADYLGVSPVFSTTTKLDIAVPLGLEGTKIVTQMTGLPTVGIGGINLHNAAEVIAAGASGVAVVSAIVSQDDVVAATSQLKRAVDEAKHSQIDRVEIQQKSIFSYNYKEKYATVLTIAGSDSGGGAGIQADIKSISANGAYAASVITALTAQNTQGVQDIFPIPSNFIRAQIRAVMEDIQIDAVKIGMLHDTETICAVRDMLLDYPVKYIVLDPVMVATSGHKLLEDDAIATLKKELIPMATLITPNIPEAEILLGRPIECQDELPSVARELSDVFGGVSVLVKAGHLTERTLIDVLYDANTKEVVKLTSQRLDTRNTHGTGCTLSSAIAAQIAHTGDVTKSVRVAQQYIAEAIQAGANYHIGEGHGPVKHFYKCWNELLEKHSDKTFACHPFFQAMIDGSLSSERFAAFLIEDSRYLKRVNRLLKHLSNQLPDIIEVLIEENSVSELDMEAVYFDRLGIDKDETCRNPEARQTIDDYLSYLESFIDGKGSEAYNSTRFAAFFECFRLYASVGEYYRKDIECMSDTHPYYDWLKVYYDTVDITSAKYEKAFLDAIMK